MSWSANVTARPSEVLEKFAATAKNSWGYNHSVGDKEAIEAVLRYLEERLGFYGGNQVPTTFVKAEGSGHWDDSTGSGSVTVNLSVFADRRR